MSKRYQTATTIIARARGQVQDAMAIGYIAMPEGDKAPAPSKAAYLAVARAAGDIAIDTAEKAFDVVSNAARQATDAIKRAADKSQAGLEEAVMPVRKLDVHELTAAVKKMAVDANYDLPADVTRRSRTPRRRGVAGRLRDARPAHRERRHRRHRPRADLPGHRPRR